MYHYLFLMSFSWFDSKLVLLKLAYYWFGFPKLCIRYCEIRSEKCAWGILRLHFCQLEMEDIQIRVQLLNEWKDSRKGVRWVKNGNKLLVG